MSELGSSLDKLCNKCSTVYNCPIGYDLKHHKEECPSFNILMDSLEKLTLTLSLTPLGGGSGKTRICSN